MTDFQLGQRVIYTHPLNRVSTVVERGRTGRAWLPSEYAALAEQEQEGIITGMRTLSNGTLQREEWGNDYSPTEHFQAYLIATGIRHKMVYVRVENVRAAPFQPFTELAKDSLRQQRAAAWLEGAAAGASVDMGFVPSDALIRPLPEHLADQFRALNPYATQEN